MIDVWMVWNLQSVDRMRRGFFNVQYYVVYRTIYVSSGRLENVQMRRNLGCVMILTGNV